jgi:hypothetical protein
VLVRVVGGLLSGLARADLGEAEALQLCLGQQEQRLPPDLLRHKSAYPRVRERACHLEMRGVRAEWGSDAVISARVRASVRRCFHADTRTQQPLGPREGGQFLRIRKCVGAA